ncbi:uncharacterized protein FTOL_07929 [Fusarium torulosum]|uniref:Uncharacterized protein n=1 Tax=Fusarium torulosum TaxID=33205 RepID=A0AAE8SJG3_9HYPO|nr:uncharacterized protein FTOL_07929 [Fusarium torulosum]
MNPPIPPRRSKRERDFSSISYVVESLPGEDLQSDYEEQNQEPGDTRTSDKTRGYPQDQPCQSCFDKMINNGPETLCSSQAKADNIACYRCARYKKKCQQISPHLLYHGARLQAAARRIANNQPVGNWDQLVTAARNAVRSNIVAKPKVTPRAQSSKRAVSASTKAAPEVQLRPSGQSPPRQGPPEVQSLPQPAAASQSPSNTILQQILAELKQNNAVSRETNQLLRENIRQQREGSELSQEQIRHLRRIIDEMNAFNEGTEANLSPFRWLAPYHRHLLDICSCHSSSIFYLAAL